MMTRFAFICIGCFELFATWKKRELQKEKFLPPAGFEPTFSRLLDWRSNVAVCWKVFSDLKSFWRRAKAPEKSKIQN